MTFDEKLFKTASGEYYNTLCCKNTHLEVKNNQMHSHGYIKNKQPLLTSMDACCLKSWYV